MPWKLWDVLLEKKMNLSGTDFMKNEEILQRFKE